MGFAAWSNVLFCVGEEVVRACAAEVGAADFGVGDGEGGLFGHSGGLHHGVAHELLEQLSLFGRHGEAVLCAEMVWDVVVECLKRRRWRK